MALSFHSNWDYLTTTAFPETHTEIAAAAAAAPELFNFYGNGSFNFHFCDTYTNPLFEADHFHDDQLFYSDTYCPNTNYNNNNNMISLSPEIFPLDEEFEPNSSYHNPNKRQKSSSFAPTSLNPVAVPEFLPEIHAPPVPKFKAPAAAGTLGRSESGKTGAGGGVSLSAQSIAARERRRKITAKTQELGKLVPGGNKMNTAEMFQAASKYVKFLQAQVGLLELMASIFQEGRETFNIHELQVLLASPTIQEKLYSEEKCLVPREFVQTLANEPEIQSKSLILDEIDHLLETNI